MNYQVENFKYNGFIILTKLGLANYIAKFKNWTNDPGITLCECSDNIERLIPSCCLIGNKSNLPKQDMSNKILFGQPSKS